MISRNISHHKNTRKALKQIFALVACLCIHTFCLAQDFFSSEQAFLPVEQAYTVSASMDSDPDKGTSVLFDWFIAPGYYLYRHQFALELRTAKATKTLELSIPDGLRKYDEVFEKELEVYYESVELSAALPELQAPFELRLMSQGCADAGLCYPPRLQYFSVIDGVITETPESTLVIDTPSNADIATTVATNDAINNALNNELNNELNNVPQSDTPSLALVILAAITGGMILNLMPCVFPVLSLKALSLASETGDSVAHKINGWSYTAGVILSFVGAAAIIVVAKSAGSALGWGFQLQQPGFVAALIYLFFLLSLNLFGLFEIGTSWMGLGQNLTQGSGATASFFTGVLAALVASPCTAPFMATAIGYTLTQGSAITLLVFICLGFGMALPYLALTYIPNIANKLPAPGAWMDTFKQVLAFPLLFTCVWLLLVFGNQTDPYQMALVVGGMVCLALGLWLLKRTVSAPWHWALRIAAAVAFALAIKVAFDARVSELDQDLQGQWQAYSPQGLADLRESNTPVFIDLTADWCITCKVNERVALNTRAVASFANTHGIVMMQGDWTKPDPEITTLLNAFGRNGVPLYLMYGTDAAQPEVLPQILSKRSVLDAMKRAIATK